MGTIFYYRVVFSTNIVSITASEGVCAYGMCVVVGLCSKNGMMFSADIVGVTAGVTASEGVDSVGMCVTNC